MKLELIKKYEPDSIEYMESCAVLNDETAIFLVSDKDDSHFLLIASIDGLTRLPCDYIPAHFGAADYPALFAINNSFGVIKDVNEIYFYQSAEASPELIRINDKRLFQSILPPRARVCSASPISDGSVFPVCFQHTVYYGDSACYIAFLNFNIEKKKAEWTGWTNLDANDFPFHRQSGMVEPPVIDGAMLINDNVYIFTSGDSAFVNKWGMCYYGIVKASKTGKITERLLDSGNLMAIDQKKRGVHAIFAASRKYVILTPVFKSDEWKGKQKLFSLETKELLDTELPRGLGKYPKIVQHSGKYFWVYVRDTKNIIICREL